ncbi:MAG: DNA-binding protein [Rhodococcus sp. (in: high G+C Gram-positive bacteria)]
MARDVPREPVDHFPKGTGRPAAGALLAAGYRSLDDLNGASESQLAGIHGVGPKAISVIKASLVARGQGLQP